MERRTPHPHHHHHHHHQNHHHNARTTSSSSSSSSNQTWRSKSQNFPPNNNNNSRRSSTTNYTSSNRRHPKASSLNSTNTLHSNSSRETALNNNPTQHHEREPDSDKFPSLVGTCPYMCPVAEMAQRERLRDLAVFERLHGDPARTSPDLAVKKFCRTISTKYVQSADVRPLVVLERTLEYLLKLMDSTEQPFEVVHDFIFDRTRSIRQDLSMQNIADVKAISMYERMVKFYVISHHRLRSASSGYSVPSISPLHQLNMEQLVKALTSLYNLYELNQGPNSIQENEPEFRSLHVLLCLDPDNQQKGEPLSLWFRHLPAQIIKSKEMSFARKILRYFRMGNYKYFFDTVEAEASHLQYCVLEPCIGKVRALAVACINYGGYKLHPYPVTHLSKLLLMEESELESFCKACGLEISVDDQGNKTLPCKQSTFTNPKEGLQSYGSVSSQITRFVGSNKLNNVTV